VQAKAISPQSCCINQQSTHTSLVDRKQALAHFDISLKIGSSSSHYQILRVLISAPSLEIDGSVWIIVASEDEEFQRRSAAR
jgi:hypothetical protein